jgi:hypothetical protein
MSFVKSPSNAFVSWKNHIKNRKHRVILQELPKMRSSSLVNKSTPSYESSNFASVPNINICESHSSMRPVSFGAIVIMLGIVDVSADVEIMRSSPLEFGSVSKYWLEDGGDETWESSGGSIAGLVALLAGELGCGGNVSPAEWRVICDNWDAYEWTLTAEGECALKGASTASVGMGAEDDPRD